MYLNTVPQLVLLFKVRGPLECEALLEEARRWRRALRTPGLLHLQLAYSASCVWLKYDLWVSALVACRHAFSTAVDI